MRKLKDWFKEYIRKTLASILKDEYYISADIGVRDTEIIVCKYSYKTGKMEIISDNHLQKTPLSYIEEKVRNLARQFNASVVYDYPATAKDFLRR